MFEQPGVRAGDNVKEDIESLRRWLARFVPELEQQLANLGTDNFTNAYNERLEGLTSVQSAGKSKSTSEAIANHLMDFANPHRVSLAKLGYVPPAVIVRSMEGGIRINLCGLVIQVVSVSLEAGTAERVGDVYQRQLALGDWPEAFECLYAEIPILSGAGMWAGGLSDGSNTSMGTLTIYDAEAAGSAGAVTLIGIGGPAYGDQT